MRMAAAFLGKLHYIGGGKDSVTVINDLDDVSCAICLEVYDKPRRIPCGHIFCKSCLAKYDGILEPACPVCRQNFTVSSARKAADVMKTLTSSSSTCAGCSQKVILSKLRHHNSTCSALSNGATAAAAAAAATSQDTVGRSNNNKRDVPNRQTFRCPYCGQQNLDTHGLVTHCNENHRHHKGQVVCPICASMPWGNPRQKSANFNYHLNLRHRFEYEFVVDYDLDDDVALQKALKASLEEK